MVEPIIKPIEQFSVEASLPKVTIKRNSNYVQINNYELREEDIKRLHEPKLKELEEILRDYTQVPASEANDLPT